MSGIPEERPHCIAGEDPAGRSVLRSGVIFARKPGMHAVVYDVHRFDFLCTAYRWPRQVLRTGLKMGLRSEGISSQGTVNGK